MIRLIAFGSLVALASCGVAGAPLTPELNAGVNVTPGGVTPSASVGAKKGPLSINLDLL